MLPRITKQRRIKRKLIKYTENYLVHHYMLSSKEKYNDVTRKSKRLRLPAILLIEHTAFTILSKKKITIGKKRLDGKK